MPDSLSDLEQQRLAVVQQISELGDLRPGSITSTSGRCGKPSCHCHQPGQPAHGPNFRITFKIAGKTVTESLPDPEHQRKAEQEIEEFRKFQKLIQEFVEINARICHLRPIGLHAPSAQEKKRPKRSIKKSRGR